MRTLCWTIILTGCAAAPFWPLIRYKIWERRWRRMPCHNPYKPGDSE